MMEMHEVEEKLNFWHFPTEPWQWGTIGNFHIDVNPRTLIVTWLTMLLVALFAVLATRKMDMKKPNGIQVTFELIYDFIKGLVNDQIADPVKAMGFLSIPLTYFIFILFSNLLGLVPTLSSPTADLNTAVGFSLCTFILFNYYGIKYKRGKHFKHFLEPYWPFLPINIVEDLSKPVTLSFRLYGNIYAGEVLILVILGLLPATIDLFGGFVVSVVWLAYSIFVGCIQAFLFTMLSIVYVGQKVSEEH